MQQDSAISEDLKKVIDFAVSQAVQQTKTAFIEPLTPQPKRNYFQIMEKLLFNYPTLKRLLSDKAAYVAVELSERSKSIVKQAPAGSTIKTRENLIDELEDERERHTIKLPATFFASSGSYSFSKIEKNLSLFAFTTSAKILTETNEKMPARIHGTSTMLVFFTTRKPRADGEATSSKICLFAFSVLTPLQTEYKKPAQPKQRADFFLHQPLRSMAITNPKTFGIIKSFGLARCGGAK